MCLCFRSTMNAARGAAYSSSSIVDEMKCTSAHKKNHQQQCNPLPKKSPTRRFFTFHAAMFAVIFCADAGICIGSFVRCFSSLIRLLTRYFICIYIYASTMLRSISFCHYFLSMSSLRPCLLNKVRVKCAQNA